MKLQIFAGAVVDLLPCWNLDNQLFDEGGYIPILNDCSDPFFDP